MCYPREFQKIAYSKNSYLFIELASSWELFIRAHHWSLLRGIHSTFSDYVYLNLSLVCNFIKI
jgi:hypothetical protein